MTITSAREISERLARSNQKIDGPRFESFISDQKGRLGVGLSKNEIGPKIMIVSFFPNIGFTISFTVGLFILE